MNQAFIDEQLNHALANGYADFLFGCEAEDVAVDLCQCCSSLEDAELEKLTPPRSRLAETKPRKPCPRID